jgi:hypothetical protein
VAEKGCSVKRAFVPSMLNSRLLDPFKAGAVEALVPVALEARRKPAKTTRRKSR